MSCVHPKLYLVAIGDRPSIYGPLDAWCAFFAHLCYFLGLLLMTFFPEMYEFATGHRAFTPEASDGLSRDVVHLAQMTQFTGQEHDRAFLEQYEAQEKLHNLKGMIFSPSHEVLLNIE
jgi:hypothetical protein